MNRILTIRMMQNENNSQASLASKTDEALLCAYERRGDDLVLRGDDGRVVVVREYFVQADAPELVTESGARVAGEIGFASLRGGTVAGDHTVAFLGEHERLTLSHVAEDRAIFAHGAVRAARWLIGRPPARYAMADVLGL